MREISRVVPEGAVVTTDVGQNQVWVAQSFVVKGGQRVIFSSGHGAMGYSIPAAIGAYYATGRPVLCITGDGGMQMNIQELAYIARENLPITICVLNNHALGMIRHFQEMYFDSKFYETVTGKGWGDPDFTAIAKAYGLSAKTIVADPDFSFEPYFENPGPQLLNIHINEPTYVVPKLEFGKPNQDQEPLLCRELYRYLMNL
nr:thiamine pyrophosphate-dependent enzyme [Gordonibacter massiliensis (ex Traore et al. 2017)]